MKYCAENQLELFEFHDARLELIRFGGGELVVSAKHLNIHKHTDQNPSDCDMEIACATITFQSYCAFSYEPDRTWETGADGKSCPIGPEVLYRGQEAEERILAEFKRGIEVFSFGKADGARYYVEGFGTVPFFTMEFGFTAVTVAWDAYAKKAWYELHRQYQQELTLAAPDGDTQVPAHIICHDVGEEASVITVGIRYNGSELWGRGKDSLWVDAFADLQKQLPAGLTLKCCLTCRHGNMYPLGNTPGELFCAEDTIKRPRQCCSVCGSYQPRTDA